jgi:hypothetical protein
MAKNENLRPFNERTEEEQRAIARKGGRASGEARRKKKQLKEVLEILLSMPSDDGITDDNWEAICLSMLNEAKSGNARAFEIIRDTIGQKPTEQQQMDLTAKIEVDYGD